MRVRSKIENAINLQVKFAYVTCNLKPLLSCFSINRVMICNFLLHTVYKGVLTFLKAKCWGKSQDFNTEGFSKAIFKIHLRSFLDEKL